MRVINTAWPYVLGLLGYVIQWFFIGVGIGSVSTYLLFPNIGPGHHWKFAALMFAGMCTYLVGVLFEKASETIIEGRSGWKSYK